MHFDAHADLRSEYLGVFLSHACVLRRCWELAGDGRIFQFGIRSGDQRGIPVGASHVKTNRFSFEGLEETLRSLAVSPSISRWISSVLDPSVSPARERRRDQADEIHREIDGLPGQRAERFLQPLKRRSGLSSRGMHPTGIPSRSPERMPN